MNNCISSPKELKLVIGFDIGTAFSSVSFALAPINGTHSHNGNPRKASTQEPIAVSFNGRHQGDDVDELVDDGSIQEIDRIQMLKLCIEESCRTQRIRDKVEALLHRLPATAKAGLMTRGAPKPGDLIGIYLRLLWKETQDQIKGHFAKSGDENIFGRCRVESWLSVPKLWSPQMNAIMVTAADWAGLPDIFLVHEPEAAAALCLLEQSERALWYGSSAPASIQGIHVGTLDSILVLDAGCGTVDLITYLIEARSPNLVIREGVRGTAGLEGSGLLNQHFMDILEPFIAGRLPTTFPEWRRRAASEIKAAIMAEAVKSFETKKKQFGSNAEKAAGKPMRIRVPGLQRRLRASQSSLSYDHIEIARTDILELFEKIVVEIISMLQQQIRSFNNRYGQKRINCILFVGGLSGNQYVFERLQETFSAPEGGMGDATSVIRPYQDSATVVSKGSVLRALHHPVSNRILTQSYGFQWAEEYCEAIHGDVDAVWDFHEAYHIVEHRIHWLCRVGDTIEEGKPTILRMRGSRGVHSEGPALLEEPLFASYTEVKDHVSSHSDGIVEVGRITMDLSHVDRSGFRRGITWKHHEEFVKMDYEIKLIFDGMQLAYELIIPTNGRWWDCEPNAPFTDEHWGPDPYKKPPNVVRNIAAAFNVSGYRAGSGRALDNSRPNAAMGKKNRGKVMARRTGKPGYLPMNSGSRTRKVQKIAKSSAATKSSAKALQDSNGGTLSAAR